MADHIAITVPLDTPDARQNAAVAAGFADWAAFQAWEAAQRDINTPLLDRLDEAAADLPSVGHVELFCGPDVYHALRVELAQDQTKGARPSGRPEINVVFTMDAKAWRLEHDGERVAEGTMEDLS